MIVVTGATGQLGRLVVQNLLDRGIPADQIVAGGRRVESLADLAERGLDVRTIDYDEPGSLEAAFKGAERVLLISGSELGRRVPQHQAAIDAAKAAGVALLGYTGVLHSGSTSSPLAPEHEATEQAILDSGLPYTFLRHGWYTENYAAQLSFYQSNGVAGAAGEGRVSAATRADFAAAAAAVLSGEGHQNQTYELAGDESFTLTDLAAEVSRQFGQNIGYTDMPEAAYADMLQNTAGLPEPIAQLLAAADTSIAKGDLFDDSRTLSRLAGRPTTPLSVALATSLAA